MEAVQISVGELFEALFQEVRQNSFAALLAMAVLIGGNVALDQSGAGTFSFAVAGILSLGVQYGLTRHALDRADLLPYNAPSRFGSLWGMNIVTGLLCAFGFILLILPGLYMMARWTLAAPIILAEDKSMSEGMSESWELARESVWSLVGAISVIFIVGFGIAMTILIFSEVEQPPIGMSVASYFFIFASSILGWLLTVSAYRLIAKRNQSLEEIFA